VDNGGMDYAQLVVHFGGLTKAADALGIDRRMVDAWKKRRIPSKWQMKAETLSGGVLKADQEAQDEAAEIAGYVAEQEKRAAA
jgi:hypothetical protein